MLRYLVLGLLAALAGCRNEAWERFKLEHRCSFIGKEKVGEDMIMLPVGDTAMPFWQDRYESIYQCDFGVLRR